MTQKNLIHENIEKLQQSNINEIIYTTTIQEINGDIVCYGNLLIEKKSGRILSLSPSHEVFWREDAISTPIAIKTKSLLDECFSLEFALADDLKELSQETVHTLKTSLETFNKLIKASKNG